MKKLINVVGAIIENDNSEILCALRSPRMSVPDRWEFPGGKVEKDESLKQAIEREIREELACTVEFNNEFLNHTHEYDGHSKSDYCKMYINIRCSEGSRTFLSIINNPLMIQKCFYF